MTKEKKSRNKSILLFLNINPIALEPRRYFAYNLFQLPFSDWVITHQFNQTALVWIKVCIDFTAHKNINNKSNFFNEIPFDELAMIVRLWIWICLTGGSPNIRWHVYRTTIMWIHNFQPQWVSKTRDLVFSAFPHISLKIKSTQNSLFNINLWFSTTFSSAKCVISHKRWSYKDINNGNVAKTKH